ncbi:MAG: glutathione S-transferase [Rhizobacter sp.]|nr:glutathione S-transferase [Rhizobacter sp.]
MVKESTVLDAPAKATHKAAAKVASKHAGKAALPAVKAPRKRPSALPTTAESIETAGVVSSDAVLAKVASAAAVASIAKAKTASLTLSSKNYSSWSMRGWLLARFAGLEFDERMMAVDDADARQEILLLSPSILVPCLTNGGVKVWDTLAIGEYLAEVMPKAGLLPADRAARAHCRAVCGEMHSGFASLRSALPMNLKGDFPRYKVWARAVGDIERITTIWRDCLSTYGGPYLFGERSMADAMYAPVATRFKTYHVKLDEVSQTYCATVLAMPEVKQWYEAALAEPEEIDELDMEF